MKKNVIISIVAVLCIVAALVVYAQMSDWHNYIDSPASGEIAAAEARTGAEYVKDAGDNGFVYREPDTRYFTRRNYKDDVFPAECRYELITLEDGKAVMLYVLLDESKIKSIKKQALHFQPFIEIKPGESEKTNTAFQYDYLVKQGKKPFVYRFALLDKNTGEEQEIANYIGFVTDKTAYKRLAKPVIYDAAVKNDLSEFRFIVDFENNVKVWEFRPKDILERQEEEVVPQGCWYWETVSRIRTSESMSSRFLTPYVVSVSYDYTEHKDGKSLPPVSVKYHLLGVKKNGSLMRSRILWCSDECDLHTFNMSRLEMFLENKKECNFYDPDEKTGGPHKWTGVPEPEYDMSEWEGWTRMNRSSAWLKK